MHHDISHNACCLSQSLGAGSAHDRPAACCLIDCHNCCCDCEAHCVSPVQVELTGRALLPPGIDDTIVPVFDDEPTSLVAYSLTTR